MTILTVALLSLSPSPHCPEPITRQSDSGLSYSYLEMGFGSGDIKDDSGSYDMDQTHFGGSFELNENIFWIASFGRGSTDFGFSGISFDIDTTEFGIGFHSRASAGMDIYGTLALVDAEVSATGYYPESLSGHAIRIGMRSMASDQLEIDAAMNMLKIESDSDPSFDRSDTSFSFGAVLKTTDTVGIGLSYSTGDDFSGVLLGVRVYL
ncbi:MAG: hypothetical protein ABGY29_09410 [bacterium]